MGNYRFRLSELMPNAWFYKLRDMGKTRKQSKNNTTVHPQKKKQHTSQSSHSPTTARCPNLNQHLPQPRKSYHFTRELVEKTTSSSPTTTQLLDQPRISSKQKVRHRRAAASAARSSPKLVSSGGCSCHSRVWAAKSESPPSPGYSSSGESSVVETFSPDLRSSPCSCSSNLTNNKNDIVSDKPVVFRNSPELELRPIITKPARVKKPTTEPIKPRSRNPNSTTPFEQPNGSLSKNIKRSSLSSSPGVRLRLSSPRISGRRSVSGARRSTSRRSVSESFAVVKSSVDPMRDFKESMVEMIVENSIRAPKDLEDLLACYLSLNSTEYHETIIKVFKQIWAELTVDCD